MMAKVQLLPSSVFSFEGDPDTLMFFKSQIEDVQKVYNYNDAQLLMFIRSKLQGPALKYIRQISQTQQIKTSQQLLPLLENFFKPTSLPQALSDLSAIGLLPGENISNLAHRLDCIVAKAYRDIKDQEALKSIKFKKLLVVLPSDIRIHLLKNNIDSYDQAVLQAQLVQDCMVSNEVLNQIHTVNSVIQMPEAQNSVVNSVQVSDEKDKHKQVPRTKTKLSPNDISHRHQYKHKSFKYKKSSYFPNFGQKQQGAPS